MAKRIKTEPNRRERLEELRRQQQAAERRRTITIIGAFTLVGLLIVGAAAYVPIRDWITDPSRKPMSAFGVPASQAGVTKPTKDKASGNAVHIDEGKLDYETVPPSSGPHRTQPASFSRTFYTPEDRPEVEQLVHNLEHGYTIVWYDETIAKDEEQMEQLRLIARRFETDEWDPEKKFIAAPWTKADGGSFPKGKHLAFTRWTTEAGRRVFAEKVSGEAIENFMKKYPWRDSPEPNGM